MKREIMKMRVCEIYRGTVKPMPKAIERFDAGCCGC